MGTIRVIFISKGYRLLAPLIGFFEVLIWLTAMTQIMQNLTNVFCYLAYAGGFAMGNFLGITIEGRISLGMVIVRVITHEKCDELIEYLKENRYGITVIEGEGATSDVKMIFSIMERKKIDTFVAVVESYNPNAFYSVEDVRFAREPRMPNLIERTAVAKRK